MKRMPAFAVAVAIVAVAAPVPPSNADPLPVSVYVDIWIESWTGDTAKICAIGQVNNGQPPWAVQWVFSASAVGTNGVNIATDTPPAITAEGRFFTQQCQYVSTMGTPNGVLTASIDAAVVDIPDLSGIDVTGTGELAATWTPTDRNPQAFWFATPY